MFFYFGFGSNMCRRSLKAKGVEPLASQKASLPGWRLRFNVQHFFRHEGGVGNIEYTGNANDQVQGLLHQLDDTAQPLLDAAEAYGHGYDRISVNVIPYTRQQPGHAISALTYIGMPAFIDDSCLPSRRYLNIVLEGAHQAGLDGDYIEKLHQHPIHCVEPYPVFTPPAGEYPTFDCDLLAREPLYTALYGAVFDMSEARPQHEFLKGFFGGKDMTLFHLKRLDNSRVNESVDDIRQGHLSQTQKRYLNAYLNEYAREYRYVGHYSYHKD